MKRITAFFAALALLASCCGPKDGEYTFRLLTTNDVHGHYFDSLYVSDGTAPALTNVSWYVDSIRTAVGAENVILLDDGDCLQGDNAAYYFNYVDTESEHVFGRMVEYMGYDAVVVGNHDIETGHPVYDRLTKEMDVPFLAANAIRTDNGKAYFQEYVTLKRHGIRITVIGFTNPNIKSWLSPLLWSGMTFESLVPFAQQTVDRIKAKEKSDVVIVAIHAGTGKGDGSQLESQGLDLFNSLEGVDYVICSHDHRPVTYVKDDICLINAGSHCRNIGHGTFTVKVEGGKVVSKTLDAGLIRVDKKNVDKDMQTAFHADYQAVKDFTLMEIGELQTDLYTRDAYRGMSDYLNLIHTLSIGCTPAQISFAAPLTFNGSVKAGTLLYNDLFTIYPFENQLFVVKMTGEQIRNFLEYSYDMWINTITSPKEHLLKIRNSGDPRTGQDRWSFVNASYNFDSAAGLNYVVDVTKPYGERVIISSLVDGSAFDPAAEYNVAMTSYRASGGGGTMREGAGIDTDRIDDIVVEYYPEIRNILYDYLKEHKTIDPAVIGDHSVIGQWRFVPEEIAEKALDNDMRLLFR
ncbi:MAG: bifunctional metallophosphatase/5'-nucleotidase [Bacteroidales bacterium]|nr:bifunctional metallophosphatase/5'-nucleotidase [Bacteroidales bacterium]MBQ8811391.1 bifunctional metallophosphatase/5'-nucleotidase [Bacteroidales bacterium]